MDRKTIACLLIGMIGLATSFSICSSALGQAPDKDEPSAAERIERATKKINKGQVYLIEYKLKKGEEIRWSFEQIATTKFQMAGEVEESSSRAQNRKLWKVLNVDQLGNMTFAYTQEWVKMFEKIGDADPISWDSDKKDKAPEKYAGTAENVGKPLAVFSITPSGEVLDRRSHIRADAFGAGKVTIPLPKQAVPVGFKWDVPIVLTANDEKGVQKNLKARILYELANVKEQNAFIRFRTEVLTPVKSEKIRSTIMQKMTKGIVVFDMEHGRPILQRMEWDEKAQGFEGADSYLKYVARMSEKIITGDDSADQIESSALAPIKGEVAAKPVELKTRESNPVMRK